MINNTNAFRPGMMPPPNPNAIGSGVNQFQPPPNPNAFVPPPNPTLMKPAPAPTLIKPAPAPSMIQINSSSDPFRQNAPQRAPEPINIQKSITPQPISRPTQSVDSLPQFNMFNQQSNITPSSAQDDSNKDKHGFIQDEMSLHDAFTLKQIKFKEALPESVYQQVVMQNGKIWIYTQRSNLLVKTEVEASGAAKTPYQVVDDQNMRQRRVKLRKMFVDRLGIHCFMLTQNEIFYNYFHSDLVKQIPIDTRGDKQPAFKSIDILKFDPNEPNFFELLLGTEDGQIFHGVCQTDPNTGVLDIVEPFKVVLKIPELYPGPILEIKMTQIKETYLVLAITATKLYQFVGQGSLQDVLKDYDKDKKKIENNALQISKTEKKDQDKKVEYRSSVDNIASQQQISDPIKLQFFYDNGLVAGFGWLNDTQFVYGQYTADMAKDSNQKIQADLILKAPSLKKIEYLKKEGDQPVEGELPTGFAITRFHICFMYPTNITVVSKISREIVYCQNYKDERILRGVQLDVEKNQLLAYSPSKHIAFANLIGEDKDAWKYYLRKANIKKALASCRTAKQKALVNGTHADQLFLTGNYEKAATYFAQSNYSFETVALKFLKYKQSSGLEVYLEKVLEVYKRSKLSTNNDIQRKVIITWIVELKLTKISSYKQSNSAQSRGVPGQDFDLEALQMQQAQQVIVVQTMEKDFHKFLTENQNDLDQDTILQLLQSHGKIEDCIKFADAMKQYQKLIVHYINKGDFKKALKKLNSIESAETRYYEMTKYMSVFIKKAANETLNALENEKFRKIDIAKLMPALMDCPDEARPRARRFVEDHCIKQRRSTESSVHNMCFYLYAKSENSDDLIDFLRKEEVNHNNHQTIFFDVTYALNVCKQMQNDFSKLLQNPNIPSSRQDALKKKELNMKKAQIILFGILNVHSKAVELALECGDQELAKDYANKPMDKKVQRDLWMKIAEHLFNSARLGSKNEVSVQDSLNFIRKYSKLKVEDLLEKFPKEAKVEEMKEHLCNCLEDYEKKISNLRNKIEKNSHNAEQLRNQKRNQRNKHITINPSQCCDICYATVFDREFYVFPCLHAFHRECIAAILRDPHYTPKDPKVKVLVNQLRSQYGKISNSSIMRNLQQEVNQQANNPVAEDKGLLSGITDFFTQSISLKGGVPVNMQMQNELQFNSLIPKNATREQQMMMADCLNQIDDILKRECIFCGPILIDMIDNDIVGGKDSEFGGLFSDQERRAPSEWDMI